MLRAFALALAILLLAPHALADEADAKNRVHFAVERSRDVENDWVTAVVGVTHEDEEPAAVAERINRDMSWGLAIARASEGIRARSGGYRTVPVQDPKSAQLKRWRGSQDLILEGADAKAMSALLGQLQARLQIRSLNFSVSDERRRDIEGELIDESLDAFRARAERVRKKLGASRFEIVQIYLGSNQPPPMPMSMQVRAMGAEVAQAPALEGGTSRIGGNAQGVIELVF